MPQNSKLNIYTAGAMKNVSDSIAKKWRYDIFAYMEREEAPAFVFIPQDYFDYVNVRHKTEKQVLDYFFHQIEQSDLMIVNLDYTNSSVGTAMEICHAHDYNIPIIGLSVNNEEVYPWCSEMCTVVFDNLDGLLEYINTYYLFR